MAVILYYQLLQLWNFSDRCQIHLHWSSVQNPNKHRKLIIPFINRFSSLFLSLFYSIITSSSSSSISSEMETVNSSRYWRKTKFRFLNRDVLLAWCIRWYKTEKRYNPRHIRCAKIRYLDNPPPPPFQKSSLHPCASNEPPRSMIPKNIYILLEREINAGGKFVILLYSRPIWA